MSSSSSSFPFSVFEDGPCKTRLLQVEAVPKRREPDSAAVPPPKQLLISTPCKEGAYPVLLLLHGYLLYNSFYSQLMLHISSHGFIVIAPQLYNIAGADTTEDIRSTAEIINWLPAGLSHFLPPQVTANLDKLALSGHSRGGKTAFALALGRIDVQIERGVSAIIGIDPVDGMGIGKQTPPTVLTFEPHCFDLNGTPVMVVGSELGSQQRNPLFPPCAPDGVNHEEFFRECQAPAWYFVVDMLDDNTKGFRGRSSYCLCKNGASREPMRRFVGGSIVAFLRAYFESDDTHLVKIRDGEEEGMPVKLQQAEALL